MEEKQKQSILEQAEPWLVTAFQFYICYFIIAGFLTLISPFGERSPEEAIFLGGIATPCAIWIVLKSSSQRRKQKQRAEQDTRTTN